jgi:hypothetical protein
VIDHLGSGFQATVCGRGSGSWATVVPTLRCGSRLFGFCGAALRTTPPANHAIVAGRCSG